VKILTLWQPWASLWVLGAKNIETRSWGTSYRGLVAVHSSKKLDDNCRHLCFEEPFKSALAEHGIELPGQLPLGKILGIVEITDCLQMVAEAVTGAPARARFISLTVPDLRLTARERAFGDWRPGRRALVTSETRVVLEEPIPYRGSQGLRDLEDGHILSLLGGRRCEEIQSS
jgi:activating signal cointegrator 1